MVLRLGTKDATCQMLSSNEYFTPSLKVLLYFHIRYIPSCFLARDWKVQNLLLSEEKPSLQQLKGCERSFPKAGAWPGGCHPPGAHCLLLSENSAHQTKGVVAVLPTEKLILVVVAWVTPGKSWFWIGEEKVSQVAIRLGGSLLTGVSSGCCLWTKCPGRDTETGRQ